MTLPSRPRGLRSARLLAMLLALVPVIGAAAGVTVRIEGVEGEAAGNVRALLSIAHTGETRPSPARVRRLHARAPAEIREALRPFGYYAPEVEASLTSANGQWRALYRIDPGPPVRVAAVDITLSGPGAGDGELQALRRDFPLKPGDVLAHRAYDSGKSALLRRAYERGYLEARYSEARMAVNVAEGRARIRLTLVTGPRYRFGAVTFEQDVVRPALLQRYVPFEPGDPYDADDLLTLRYALDDSGYFSGVDIEARRSRAEGLRIPVRVRLEPRPPHSYRFGVGFGTDTGPRLTAGYEDRRVNRRGHRLRADLTLSPVLSSLDGRYSIPTKRPATDSMALSFGVQREEIEDRISVTDTVAVSRTQTRGRWQRTYRLAVERERFELADGETGRSVLVLPGARLLYARGDDPVYPSRGLRASLDVRGGSETLGSDTSFLRGSLAAKWLRDVPGGGRVILRGEAGRIVTDEFGELPLSQRFFAGGDHSVRGYDYKSIGPRDADGDLVGGTRLLVASVEYDHPLSERWSAAVFFDAGDAFDGEALDFKRGAGAGLRWRTPVGPLRVDLARTVGEPDVGYRVHITLGPDL